MSNLTPIASELIRDRTERMLGQRPALEAARPRRSILAPARAAAARALHAIAERVEPAARRDPVLGS